MAVARLAATLLLGTVRLHKGAIVQAVPYPQAHILGNEQGLGGHPTVVHIGGDVDESRQLFMYRIIRCPHPLVVVVGTVHLNQSTVVAVSVMAIVFLVAVEVSPTALYLPQFGLRCKVACLAVAAQLLVIYKGALLALSQLVYHAGDILQQLLFFLLVRAAGVCHRHC